MRMRSVFAFFPVIAASALFTAVMPAGVSAASVPDHPGMPPGSRPAGASQAWVARAGVRGLPAPSSARTAISAAGPVLDDVLNGDSCTNQPDNPSITSTCEAVGFFAGPGFVSGLQESSANGVWGSNSFGNLSTVTDPIEVSCVPQQFNIPACVAVGEHFNNPAFPAQLVETGDANGFSLVAFANPRGATWSGLGDVSCVSSTRCMLVGAAGTTRRTARGLVYLSHATAFLWNGSALRQLTVPAPAGAQGSELGGVSCPTATTCMTVGNYTGPGGRFLPYSALWTNGTWHVRVTPVIRGRATTEFQAVSCATAATCVAVGDAAKPGFTAFAERYARGRWAVQRIAFEPLSVFFSVACTATFHCVAAGAHGTRSLIETWNGTRWAVQTVPPASAPLTTEALLHVSCVTTTICTAVGYRHNPALRFSFRTLALGWNGSRWTIQKTIND
jgi:hypothetical protein